MEELSYSLNTLYMLLTAALVMWMAAGFTMLEAGLVRRRNTAEIVTKNVGLYSISCFMFLLCGYLAMYPGEDFAGGWLPPFDLSFGDTVADANIAGLPPRLHLPYGGPRRGGWCRMGLSPSG